MVVPVLRMEDVMPCPLRSNVPGLGPDRVLPVEGGPECCPDPADFRSGHSDGGSTSTSLGMCMREAIDNTEAWLKHCVRGWMVQPQGVPVKQDKSFDHLL